MPKRNTWRSPTDSTWQSYHDFKYYASAYPVGACKGAQCMKCAGDQCMTEGELAETNPEESLTTALKGLPEGETEIEAKVWNPVGLTATATATVKIDNTPPHSIEIAGLPESKKLGPGAYHLTATATDGSGSTPSQGQKF